MALDTAQPAPSEEFTVVTDGLPAVGDTFHTKTEFIETCTKVADAAGFRLWVAEGSIEEGLHLNHHFELLCYKYRRNIPSGKPGVRAKRTRNGGCKFKLVLKWISHMNQWTVAVARPTHNHPMSEQIHEEPEHKPKRPRPKRTKLAENELSLMEAGQTTAEPSDDPALSTEARPKKVPRKKKVTAQSSLPLAVSPTAESNSTPQPHQLSLNDMNLLQNSLDTSMPPYSFHYSAPSHLTLPTDFVQQHLSADPSTYSQNLDPMLAPSRTAYSTGPNPSAMMSSPTFSNQSSVQPIDKGVADNWTDYLTSINAPFSVYADAFEKLGCPDPNALFTLPDDEIRKFVDVDLPMVYPDLQQKRFHLRILSTHLIQHAHARRDEHRRRANILGLPIPRTSSAA